MGSSVNRGSDEAAVTAFGCTCDRLRKVARRLTQRYDEVLAPAGLRVTQFSLLATLRHNPGLNVTDLARRMAMDRTTLVRNLRPLQAAGYVAVIGAGDGNARAVSLTDAGRAALRRAAPLWRQVQQETAARLGRANVAALHVLLDDALGRLEAGPAEAV